MIYNLKGTKIIEITNFKAYFLSRTQVINDEIQKKVTKFEHILIAMQVNKDDMTIAQFKTYLSVDSGNRVTLWHGSGNVSIIVRFAKGLERGI